MITMIELDIPAGFFADVVDPGDEGDTRVPMGRRLAVVESEKKAGNVRIAGGAGLLDRISLFFGRGELATLSEEQIASLRVR